MKFSLLAWFAFTGCSALSAQDSVPAVVFRGDCKNAAEIPSYQSWFQQTGLPQGKPYLVPSQQRQHVLDQYAKIRLQMSLKEVETFIGKPDFSKPLQPARLDNTPEPSEQDCSNQLAYIFSKNGENMVDTEDVAIYLFFSEDDKLYWASPQNLPSLKSLGSPTEKLTQQHRVVSWKEYTFADDGFAVTLPEAPSTDSRSSLPEMAVYTVSLLPDSKLRLQVSHRNRDCDATLAQLRKGAIQGKSGADRASLKEVSIDGHPGVEYQYKNGISRAFSDRLYCVNGKFYWFSSYWPDTQPRPAGVDRIVKSFRLLDSSTRK